MTEDRCTDISTVLFRVERRPVFLRDNLVQGPCDRDLAPQQRYVQVENYEAIVDMERKHTFAVVGENYRLVTNKEAIELGHQCFRKVFTKAMAEGMEVFNITMPKTRSFCHIDFINENVCFEPWQNDKWAPYLRVTNSYNRMKPLRFDIGFCRWICTNGMIFGDKSIQFRFLHTRDAIGKVVEFKTTFSELKELETQFIEQVRNLKKHCVPTNVMLGLACKVFDIRATAEDLQNRQRRERLIEFRNHIAELTERYFGKLGQNGYAALNVLTDFASRPTLYIAPKAMVDCLQKRSGDWVTAFLNDIEKKDFDFDGYLGEYARVAEVLAA